MVVEDARTVFEDLGDYATVRAIDHELRTLEAEFADAPMSIPLRRR